MTDLFSCSEFDIFEGMTSISAVINSIREGISDRRIIRIIYDRSRASAKARELKFLKAVSSELGFSLEDVSADDISSLVSGETHGGIVAICTKTTTPPLTDDFIEGGDFFVLLQGIEDPYNFGYCIRSLYAAGVDGILLPERNWLEYSGVVAKSSAGTSELSNVCSCEPVDAIKAFKNKGFEVVCAEIKNSVSIYEHDFNKPVLLVLGGEKRGLSRGVLDLADANVRIDYGRKFMGSLPSAAAISVISFEIAHQKGRL